MIELLNVALNFGTEDLKVGRLISNNKKILFEYYESFLHSKYSISPFFLPLTSGIQSFDAKLFEGLPGVFNDSLPDGWGRLLLDRALRMHGLSPINLNVLDRLAYVGHHGMGALVYEPEYATQQTLDKKINLDMIAAQTKGFLKGESTAMLDELVALNGSSAGARPKVLLSVSLDKKQITNDHLRMADNFEHWLVKFANSADGTDCGAIEYTYSQIAKMAGINMAETYLFPAKQSAGYFATKRFDRSGNKRLHLHSACGLLHSDFRTPTLDYADLVKLTLALTKDAREVEKLFRLAVFNVCAHNRDDHSKNFSYLMDEDGNWTLSPAYDLNFSSGPNGEQSTTVMGEGRNPSIEHLYKLAAMASIEKTKAQEIIEQCHAALSRWPALAKENGVGNDAIQEITRELL